MAVLAQMTNDTSFIESELHALRTCGTYGPVTQFLTAISTGDLTPFAGWGGLSPLTWTCPDPDDRGWPCFRPGTTPVVVHMSDDAFAPAWTSCSPGYTTDDAITALASIDARYVGINSGTGSYSAHNDMWDLAVGTDSTEFSGRPFVFDITSSGTGIDEAVVDTIELAVRTHAAEVTAVVRDDESDGIDAVWEFIDHVEPSLAGGWPDPDDPTRICASDRPVADLVEPLDGRPDTFAAVYPDMTVCFDVYVKQNWTVPATRELQVLLAHLDVVTNTGSVIVTRDIYFVIPPIIDVTPCED
jgi:hypothetical protein